MGVVRGRRDFIADILFFFHSLVGIFVALRLGPEMGPVNRLRGEGGVEIFTHFL